MPLLAKELDATRMSPATTSGAWKENQAVSSPSEGLAPYVGHSLDDVTFVSQNIQSAEFHSRRLRRMRSEGSTFDRCSFKESAALGSRWVKSEIHNSGFVNANFQYSQFESIDIVGCDISAANFLGSVFIGGSILFSKISGTSLSQSSFRNMRISSCNVQATSLEGAEFIDCDINDFDFSENNIDWVDFSGSTFNNCKMSFLQLPYTFGIDFRQIGAGLLEIASVSSDGNWTGRIEVSDLKKLLGDLINLYIGKHDFLPIANLFLLAGRKQECRQFLAYGWEQYIRFGQYRELKIAARLAALSEAYTAVELADLYDMVVASVIQRENGRLTKSFLMHEGELRSYLKPWHEENALYIHMNFKSSDLSIGNQAQMVIREANNILREFGYSLNVMEMSSRRNSPEHAVTVAKIENHGVINIYVGPQGTPPDPLAGRKHINWTLVIALVSALATSATALTNVGKYFSSPEAVITKVEESRERLKNEGVDCIYLAVQTNGIPLCAASPEDGIWIAEPSTQAAITDRLNSDDSDRSREV